ncbi:MAG: beta-lactamase family protein [Treponema sp.]|nr:beta-lactamase family protein [Treponema sp.]
MRGRLILLCGLCAVLILFIVSCTGQEKAAPEETPESLEETVKQYIRDNTIKTALSAAVFNGTNSFSVNTGYTSTSGKKMNDDSTLHYLYSITKTVVGAVMLDQIQKGNLSLDTPVSSILDIPKGEYINTDATVRELLTHTSGIEDYVDNARLFYANPFRTKVWDPFLLLDFVEHPAVDRGSFMYSSTNFLLLGCMLERKTGIQLNILISDFLNTAGVTGMYLSPQDTIDYSRISHPHVYPGTTLSLTGDGITPIDITTVISDAVCLIGKSGWAAGGMVSTAAATARWGYNLYSDKGTVDSHIRECIYGSVSKFSDPSEPAYGYGVRKIFYKNTVFIGSYGRSIGSENLMFYNPDTDTCFVILTSSNTDRNKKPDIDDLLYKLYEVVLNGNEEK